MLREYERAVVFRLGRMIDALYLVQLMLNGLMLGLLYALIAAGLSLIFGVMEIINFAHGEFLMLGAYAMAFVLPVVGLLYWPALVAAILGVMLVGLLVYEVLLARLKPDEFERSILITLGLSIVLIHAMQLPVHRHASAGRHAVRLRRHRDRLDPHHLDAGDRRGTRRRRLRRPLFRAAPHAVRPRHARHRAEPRGGADGRHPPARGGTQRRDAGGRRCAVWPARRSRLFNWSRPTWASS